MISFLSILFSHMPDTTWFRWLQTLYNAVSLTDYSFSQLMDIKVKSTSVFPLNEQGYWFLPSSEQLDLDVHQYGQTIVSPLTYVTKLNYYLIILLSKIH